MTTKPVRKASVKLSISLPVKIAQWLRDYCEAEEETMSSVIRDALKQARDAETGAAPHTRLDSADIRRAGRMNAEPRRAKSA